MSLVINSKRSSSRDAFRAHVPRTDRHRSSRSSSNHQINGERFCRDWFAERTWEDDGGRIGQECECAA